MNLQSDDFELFGMPERFAQDRQLLDQRWKELQRQVHPDRFSAQGSSAQRVAMQWSVRINEAYQRLKDPMRRAAYLCELRGVPIEAEDNTSMPASFLVQQMEWRELLDEVTTASEVKSLQTQVGEAERDSLMRCALALDDDRDTAIAVSEVRALMFLARFKQNIEQRLDELEH